MSNHLIPAELNLQPARYSLLWPIVGLAAILCITFYPYLFGGKIMLPTDMYDTMTSPSNAQYGPPQAQNHYFYDVIVQGYPYKLRTEMGLRNGLVTYWDPHIFGGVSSICGIPGKQFRCVQCTCFMDQTTYPDYSSEPIGNAHSRVRSLFIAFLL